jgi:hypothetical protein
MVKVQSSLCLIKHRSMKKYAEMEVQIHVFLTSALDIGESLASRPGSLTVGIAPPPVPTELEAGRTPEFV